MYYTSKSVYLSSSVYPGSLYLAGRDPHCNPPTAYKPVPTTAIWTVAKNVSGSYSSMSGSATAIVFTSSFKPDGVLSTVVGEGWVFGPYTGVFAVATMSISLSYDATVVSAQQGRFFCRFWKASSLTTTDSSLITPSVLFSNVGTVTAGQGLVLSASYLLTSSLVMNNEYIFVENAWGITTAAGSSTANVRFLAGSASVFKTGPFEDNTIFIVGDDMPGLT